MLTWLLRQCFQIKDFHLSNDEKEIGAYAGWISECTCYRRPRKKTVINMHMDALPQHLSFLLRNSALPLCGVECRIDMAEDPYYSQAWLVIQSHLVCLASARVCGGRLAQERFAALWMATRGWLAAWSARSRTIQTRQRPSPSLVFAGAQAWLVMCCCCCGWWWCGRVLMRIHLNSWSSIGRLSR